MEFEKYVNDIKNIAVSERIKTARKRIFDEPRYVSVEQALIITDTYKRHENEPRILQRAYTLSAAMHQLCIRIDPEELIVGNRTAEIRAGVVFPEAGVAWIEQELDTFSTRPQDQFNVKEEDKRIFLEKILPYWKGRGLRDEIEKEAGPQISAIETVVKINQKDHAQGHICPDTKKWLRMGPAGLKAEAQEMRKKAVAEKKDFYDAVIIVLSAAQIYIERYGKLALQMAAEKENKAYKKTLEEAARICNKLSAYPPETFHEALQSVWFLFVFLHMESNANSFSPGRMDQYLYLYFKRDFDRGVLSLEATLELLDAFYIKLNHIVYMRNTYSAKYFAGFTTGFNVAVGGKLPGGEDGTNLLSFLFLAAQSHIRLAQPNLSARLHKGSPDRFIQECSRVIGLGTGMPQVFNDESIIPALKRQGISDKDAEDYAIVGCVELTTHGDNLGWSDAAMFNLVKVLELTINNGICMLTGCRLGLQTGYLYEYPTFKAFEDAYKKQMDFFIDKMHQGCMVTERMHAEILPSPFLSSVISDCIKKGVDVTAGGAHYNFTGVQAIQVANIADCMAVIKAGVFDKKLIEPSKLLAALTADYENEEILRQTLINKIPKYGNDVAWVDGMANKWISYFESKVGKLKNQRNGKYQVGLYTVSAHVPMGLNVAATPDGRKARQPLADGGMSPVYGRDKNGPTAVLKSASHVNALFGSNGTLLNMKFTPVFFKTEENIQKFSAFLKGFVRLGINHIQFNVVTSEELLEAQQNPEQFRNLLVRVAGYTAYFTELEQNLQNEIIARTTFGEV